LYSSNFGVLAVAFQCFSTIVEKGAAWGTVAF